MPTKPEKRCRGCGKSLPLSAYYRDPGGALGVKGRCRDCYSEASRRAYAANAGLRRAQQKARYWRDPERHRGYVRRWADRHREQKRAIDRASRAQRRADQKARSPHE